MLDGETKGTGNTGRGEMKKHFVLALLFVCAFLVTFAGCTHKNKTAEGSGDQTTITFDPAEVMQEPGKLLITYGDKTIEARKNNVSWAYAIDDEKWGSVDFKGMPAIDGPYDDRFTFDEDAKGVIIRFESFKKPDFMVYLNRYPYSNWTEDPEYKNEEGHRLRDMLEHHDDYEEFEPVEINPMAGGGFTFMPESGEEYGGYIYEVKAVWDTKLYRGSCIYSFVIEE